MIYEIPTSSDNQIFRISLAGVYYSFNLYWNKINTTWMIDIADTNNNPIISGIPLVANVDLLKPYGYLNFGGQLIAQTDQAPDVPPDFNSLGLTGHLYFVTIP